MWNLNKHQRHNKEDHPEEDKITDDYTYKYKSDGSISELDEFFDSWRNEMYWKESILRLNDDCLYKIISYLPANDLCALSETCRDFRRLSHWYFERHTENFRLERTYFYDKPLNDLCVDTCRNFRNLSDIFLEENNSECHFPLRKFNNTKLSDVKRCIRNFGQYLTKLTLEYYEFQFNEKPIRLLPLLDRYCTKLQDLTFDVVFSGHHVPVNIIQNERLNSDLLRLTILNYDRRRDAQLFPIDVHSILTHFVSLKHLELNGAKWIVPTGTVVMKRYEKLESLSLRNFVLPRTDLFSSFLTENCQLKRIKLSCCFVSEISGEGNVTITLPNLESLWLRSQTVGAARNRVDSMRLRLANISGDIPALKELLIDLSIFQKSNLESFLARKAAHNIIENLSILNSYAFTDELISYLCGMTTLKRLKFECVDGFNYANIRKLACSLSNLTYVGFHVCAVDLAKIENFMEYSHSINTIALMLVGYGYLQHNSLTETSFLSMVNARLRNKHNNETLSLIFDKLAVPKVDSKIANNGIEDLLLSWAHIIKVLT